MRRPQRRVVTTCLAALLAATGCLHVGHIQVLRDSQEHFSELARLENDAALRSAAPPRVDPLQLAPRVPARDATGFYHGYRGIYLDVEALRRRAGRRLAQDGLASSAALLSLLACWRMAYNGHLAALQGAALEPLPTEAGATSGVAATALPSLASVRALARSAREEARREQLPVLPRDAYLMDALPALLRYDIAYLEAVRAARNGTLASAGTPADQDTAKRIVGQMVRAENELAEDTRGAPRSVKPYALLARYQMLVNARLVAAHVKIDARGIQAGALPELRERSCGLHAELGAGTTPAGLDPALLLPERLCSPAP
jgi:hypothetical protein